MPTFGSLFAGIGGLDLGLERAGWECKWQVEIDPWCQRVLTKHWPDVPKWGPVETFPQDAAIQWGPFPSLSDSLGNLRVDLIAGGFPCQPVSVAGRRRGQNDERWLWPEFARVLRVLRPRFALIENVPGLLARGMGDVLGDLAELGFDAEWATIPAAAVGAPHLRYRVFIVAYSNGTVSRRERGIPRFVDRQGREPPKDGAASLQSQGREARNSHVESTSEDVANADQSRLEGRKLQPERPGEQSVGSSRMADASEQGLPDRRGTPLAQHHRTEQEPDGRYRIFEGLQDDPRVTALKGWWATEPDVGRVAHGIPSRVDRLRGLGNAVVPQVAEWIGRRLLELRPPSP